MRVSIAHISHDESHTTIVQLNHVTDQEYSMAKTHRMPEVAGHFPQKSPIMSGSSVETA